MRNFLLAILMTNFLLAICTLIMTDSAYSQVCKYYSPGDLISGTGQGVDEETNYAPDMLYPFVGVIGTTKSAIHSPGDQCQASNFDLVNRDTFCETRTGTNRESLNCPRRDIHQGIDINGGTPATCELMRKAKHDIDNGGAASEADIVPVLAVEDGIISYIGSYTVDLRIGGRTFRYLHMKMDQLRVSLHDTVKKGTILGYMWNDFGGELTKFHLHLEIHANIAGTWRHVSPYLTYIRSAERVLGVQCKRL